MRTLPADEHRTWEQIREHYEIEKELAGRLRTASREERPRLYSVLYDELYRRVPHHPRVRRRLSLEEAHQAARQQMRFLRRFLRKDSAFLEVGPGDCSLSFEAAKRVERVYAADVSEVAARRPNCPKNFELIIYDGCHIPLPENSIHVAYSNSVMEHLHPEDAFEHLQSIYSALAPGGMYVCVTPNRLLGPTDISKYFDEVPTGFHMKEYSTGDLSRVMRGVGFRKVRVYVGGRGIYLRSPLMPVLLCEAVLDRFPYALRKRVARTLPFRAVLGVRLVGVK
jgi:SAM-dependent methyltransferase